MKCDKNLKPAPKAQCAIQNVVGSDLRCELVGFAYWYENKPKERKGCNTIGDIVDAYLNSKSYIPKEPPF